MCFWIQETFATYTERTAFERPLMSGVAYAERVLHANRASFEATHGWHIKEMFSKERQLDFDEYAPTIMSQKTVFYLTSIDMMSGQVCAFLLKFSLLALEICYVCGQFPSLITVTYLLENVWSFPVNVLTKNTQLLMR